MRKISAVLAALGILGVSGAVRAVNYDPTYLPPLNGPPGDPAIERITYDLLNHGVISHASELGCFLYKIEKPNVESGNVDLFNGSITQTALPGGVHRSVLTYTGGGPAPMLTFLIVNNDNVGYTVWDARSWTPVFTSISVDNRGLRRVGSTNLRPIYSVQVFGLCPVKVSDSGHTGFMLGAMFGVFVALRHWFWRAPAG
jgi:hypothetical protein